MFDKNQYSYALLAGVRASLAQDPNWIELNAVGVYELRSFQMHPGGPAVWGEAFQAAVSAHAAGGHAHLVGVFHSEFGWLNNVNALWWYESPDQRAALCHKAHGDARVVAAVRESVTYLGSQMNKLMFPCPHSPLK
ncbi:protein NipSnap homolog 3A-like [Salvelinus namaycush]|uniref:Protein NipSnap homolog 3A-like n=1 Tax=Salvelinus namaycush TaxID=8040 RepID=A0A8U1F0X8_SALNM|nr:protein NipSnap homolog 3A-like [Salvelinus namaycush]